MNTPPTNAYWGLCWSDGTAASWTYSSEGVDSLDVPEGGSVAFSWQGRSRPTPAEPPAPEPRQTAGNGGGYGEGQRRRRQRRRRDSRPTPAPDGDDTPSGVRITGGRAVGGRHVERDERRQEDARRSRRPRREPATEEPSATPEAAATAEDLAEHETAPPSRRRSRATTACRSGSARSGSRVPRRGAAGVDGAGPQAGPRHLMLGRPAAARPAPGGLVALGDRAWRPRRRSPPTRSCCCMLIGVAAVVVMARRSDHPWARSFRLYVWLGLVIVVIRVVFRIIFGGGFGTVLIELPEIPLPGLGRRHPAARAGHAGGGARGLYDGLRLATIVICVGAANSLANPKRLLKSVPPALYEIGTALVVAVTVLPQLADSVRRVRAAQACGRGHRPDRAAAPAPGARARGRAGAVAGARRRHGHARLRPRRRPDQRPAPAHRRADADRAVRHLRRHLRRCSTRPRRGSWPSRCWCSACSSRSRASSAPAAGSSARRYRPDRWRGAGARGRGLGVATGIVGLVRRRATSR